MNQRLCCLTSAMTIQTTLWYDDLFIFKDLERTAVVFKYCCKLSMFHLGLGFLCHKDCEAAETTETSESIDA